MRKHFNGLIILAFVGILGGGSATAQITITSGLAELGDYAYDPVTFDQLVNNSVLSVTPGLTTESFSSSAGSSNGSYELIDGKMLTIQADSVPSPEGPDPISHQAKLTLDLEFATSGVLNVLSPPPQVYSEFEYGQVDVSGGADLEGGWYGDWPPDPDAGPPTDYTWRTNYTDSVAVDAGSYRVSVLATGGVSRGGSGFPSTSLVEFTFLPDKLAGDFNNDGLLDAVDIDLLSAQVRAASHLRGYDLNGDLVVNQADRAVWITDLKQTWVGDANLDGRFDTSDLLLAFKAGEYEDRIRGNSAWADGDWDGSGDFDTGDLVAALSDGGYEQGPRKATAQAVPEPAGLGIGLLAWWLLQVCRVRRLRRRSSHRSLIVA